MVEVTVANKTKNNYYELKVVQLVKSLSGASSLTTFEDNFKCEIFNIPKKTTATADTLYKLRWVGDQWTNPNAHIEIWHKDNDGNDDRLIATIKRK